MPQFAFNVINFSSSYIEMVHGFKKCEIFELKNVAMENYNTDVNNPVYRGN